jgi:hypothetical protein
MVRVDEYPERVQQFIQQYADQKRASDNIETQVIFDTQHHHYQLVNVGWIENKRVYGCVLHIDVKGNKVWIQHNGTELPVAEELVALGIPEQAIVLGFHAPYKRPFTKFAVN